MDCISLILALCFGQEIANVNTTIMCAALPFQYNYCNKKQVGSKCKCFIFKPASEFF